MVTVREVVTQPLLTGQHMTTLRDALLRDGSRQGRRWLMWVNLPEVALLPSHDDGASEHRDHI